jgi:peptidoglycan/xylan/chitin deacetylase (PgdA/CDA1 family)
VENHTWSHPDLTKVSAAEFQSQVSRTSAVIGGCRFLRPPYGSSDASVKKQAAAMGLRLAFWTVDTLDWEHQDVNWIMSNVKAETKPGAIILMHDGGKDRLQTVVAIPVVVNWLFGQGYSLTIVDQIL